MCFAGCDATTYVPIGTQAFKQQVEPTRRKSDQELSLILSEKRLALRKLCLVSCLDGQSMIKQLSCSVGSVPSLSLPEELPEAMDSGSSCIRRHVASKPPANRKTVLLHRFRRRDGPGRSTRNPEWI